MSDIQKYVIIGSNCFSASNFVDLLLDDPNNHVIGISRSSEKSKLFLPYKFCDTKNFEFHQLDLVRQPDDIIQLLDEIKPDYVVNYAALSEVALSNFKPNEYFQVNTLGVVNLCNQLRTREYLRRYIHISSAEVYGRLEGTVTETAPLNPSTPYAVSKAAADLYLLTLVRNFDFPVNIIRSTNVYGKHQQLFKIIHRTVIYLKKERKIELHGGGLAVKSFIHIRDVAQGIMKVIQLGKPGEIYHFSTQNRDTIADIVRMICEKMGYDYEENTSIVGERLGQDPQYILDCTKSYNELDWFPQISFDEGLNEVITWIEESWGEILEEPLEYIHKV